MNNVDIVITWVDGSDPVWRKKRAVWQERRQEQEQEPVDSLAISSADVEGRYRDNGELRYLLRSIETYWPGTPRIFLVNDNQIPKWLNKNHPQLQVIDHREFIPEKYLPLFSSQAIECLLHRISGLADEFVYFNDDLFLASYPDREWLFGNHGAVFPVSGGVVSESSKASLFSDEISVINSCHWIAQNYGVHQERWLPAHAPRGLNRIRLLEMENHFPALFHQVLSQRFRSVDGYSIPAELYLRWCLAEGMGEVREVSVLYIESCADNARQLYRDGLKYPEQWQSIAINDTGDNRSDLASETRGMMDFLNTRFPVPSSFEI